MRRTLVAVGLFCASVLGFSIFATEYFRFPMQHLTKDPTALLRLPVYIGALSNLGLQLWMAAATACALGYAGLRRLGRHPREARFLLAAGLFSLAILADDMFRLHEDVYPRFLGGEKFVFSLYGLIWLAVLVRFRDVIRRTEFGLLAVAMAFFAIMAVADLMPTSHHPGPLVEDGSKLVAITTWLAYLARTSLGFLLGARAAGAAAGRATAGAAR